MEPESRIISAEEAAAARKRYHVSEAQLAANVAVVREAMALFERDELLPGEEVIARLARLIARLARLITRTPAGLRRALSISQRVTQGGLTEVTLEFRDNRAATEVLEWLQALRGERGG